MTQTPAPKKSWNARIAACGEWVARQQIEWILQEALERVHQRRFTALEFRERLEQPSGPGEVEIFLGLLDRVARCEPLQYVLGNQHFLSHRYRVSPAVLIPRAETELLVTKAVQALETRRPLQGGEVGLGSGAISIELLSAFPALRMRATEASEPALAVARGNAEDILGAGASRLDAVEVGAKRPTLEAFAGLALDFFISNPPYLRAQASEVDPNVMAWEPALALFPPPEDLLRFYREFAEGLPRILKPGAPLFLELPHERADAILELFRGTGAFSALALEVDLTGKPRYLRGERNG